MQRRWYDCRSSTKRVFSNSKVHIRQQSKDFVYFHINSLQKITFFQREMEIRCQVTLEMSLTLKNGQLVDRLIELVDVVFSEPTPPIILGSFLADEIDVECASNGICKTNSMKVEKRKRIKDTRSYDIRDMFRRQNEPDSKRLRDADKDPVMIIIDNYV